MDISQFMLRRVRRHGTRGSSSARKAPLELKDIWAIRLRPRIGGRTRELALFNLAIDSKLRSCDLVRLRVTDVCCHGNGRRFTNDSHAAEDPAPGAIRTHRADS
jgi:hypothetical protein